MILGESGSGKTYSIKGLKPEEVGIFAVEKSLLPFRNTGYKVAKNADYNLIMAGLKKPQLKTYVIDDSQYLMVNEFFDKAKDAGYQKYTDIGLHFRNLIHHINKNIPDDVIVYFLHHTEIDTNTGKTKAKTVGKMLDNYVTVEGRFTIVMKTVVQDGRYLFSTQNNGQDTVKTPMGLFDKPLIDNDLKAIDLAIREYWGMDGGEESA